MNRKNILIYGLLLLACNLIYAHDFELTTNGHKLYFIITDSRNLKAEVTYNGSITNTVPGHYEGRLTIPEKVKYNGKVYTITGITAKAFSGADKLSGVEMPSTIVRIGDFAFEGCKGLKNIVFPASMPKMGEGVFFKCDSIANITFGSEWKTVDLTMFRWSKVLQHIAVPAKVNQLKGLKSLRCLKTIAVDANNANFATYGGALYNKDCTVLYGCPRAYSGTLKIKKGTKNITTGAIVDCNGIETIVLPETLTKMSFRELSRIANLKEIVFLSAMPINTAQCEDHEVFVLQVTNNEVNVMVPKGSGKAYAEALVQTDGEYKEIGTNVPIRVRTDEMPDKDRIKEIDDIKKYE